MLLTLFGLLGVSLIVGTHSASPWMGENYPPISNNSENSSLALNIPTYPDYVPAPATPLFPLDQIDDEQDDTSKQSITESNLQVQPDNWKTRIYTSLEPLKSYALSYAAHLIDTLVYITSTVIVGLISTSIFCSLTSVCNFEINGVGSASEIYRGVRGVARYFKYNEEEIDNLAGNVTEAVNKFNHRVRRSDPTFEELTRTKTSPLDHLTEYHDEQSKRHGKKNK